MSQATTDATLCFTADAGRMATPICAPTSEITVRGLPRSAKHWEQFWHREASRRLDRRIQGHSYAHSSRSSHPTLHLDAPFFFWPVYETRAPRVRTVPDALSEPQEPTARQSGGEKLRCPANLSAA